MHARALAGVHALGPHSRRGIDAVTAGTAPEIGNASPTPPRRLPCLRCVVLASGQWASQHPPTDSLGRTPHHTRDSTNPPPKRWGCTRGVCRKKRRLAGPSTAPQRTSPRNRPAGRGCGPARLTPSRRFGGAASRRVLVQEDGAVRLGGGGRCQKISRGPSLGWGRSVADGGRQPHSGPPAADLHILARQSNSQSNVGVVGPWPPVVTQRPQGCDWGGGRRRNPPPPSGRSVSCSPSAAELGGGDRNIELK